MHQVTTYELERWGHLATIHHDGVVRGGEVTCFQSSVYNSDTEVEQGEML
jgi:hypothetical protein